ncbi:MAG: hypothetical protein VKJ46_04550 [Leptolyngbyaceae bacterium]|nr:hypothetical protein [Leptolyngbyaceae bacterium]
MRLIKKLSAGLLLSFGFLFLMVAASGVLDKEAEDRSSLILGGLALGIPPSVAGLWLLRGISQEAQKSTRDRLQATFFQLLKEGQGNLTVLRFAMETQLPGEAAKQFLDQKAKEFGATFDVDESGGIFYQFPLGDFDAKFLDGDGDSP